MTGCPISRKKPYVMLDWPLTHSVGKPWPYIHPGDICCDTRPPVRGKTAACVRRCRRSAQMSPPRPGAASLDGPSSGGSTTGEREREQLNEGNGRVTVHL